VCAAQGELDRVRCALERLALFVQLSRLAMFDPRIRRTTWAALGLHLAVLLAVARTRVPARPQPPPPAEDAAMDLDLGEPAGAVGSASPAPAPASASSASSEGMRALGRGAIVASRERAREGERDGLDARGDLDARGEERGEPASAATEAGGPGGATSAGAPVMLVRPSLPIGGPNPFVGAREAGPARAAREATEANERAEQALRQPARAREAELGLGPDGPVRQALADATAEGVTDVTGKAVFVAVADGSGMVLSVDLLSCDGGRPGWSDAARAALAKLRGKKLRLPSTAKRAEMTIEVTSEWKLPSGHDPGVDVEVFHIPVKKGEGKHSPKVTILDPIPKIHMVELAKDLKIPVPQIDVTILGTNADPTDIGAKPRRIVHTRVVESKVL
jgi:hypothetical protein